MVFKYTLLEILFGSTADEPTPHQKKDTKSPKPMLMPTAAPPPPPAAIQQEALIQDSLSRERITSNVRRAAFTEKFNYSIPTPPPQQEHPVLRSSPPQQENSAFKSQARFA